MFAFQMTMVRYFYGEQNNGTKSFSAPSELGWIQIFNDYLWVFGF